MATKPTSIDFPYAVLNSKGELLKDQSHRYNEPVDPASTTKLWTLYTLLRMEKDGREGKEGGLPPGFIKKNQDLIDDMMKKSDNIDASKLALKAAGASDKEIKEMENILKSMEARKDFSFRVSSQSGADGRSGAYGAYDRYMAKFVEKMNEYAKEEGLDGTQFKNANGMPQLGHYSTVADMARMAFVIDRDFGGIIDSMQSMTRYKESGHRWHKGGTGGGAYGDERAYDNKSASSDVGAVVGGYYAVGETKNKDVRNNFIKLIPSIVQVGRVDTSPDLLDELDSIDIPPPAPTPVVTENPPQQAADTAEEPTKPGGSGGGGFMRFLGSGRESARAP